MIKLAPSILSADFTKLGKEIKTLEENNISYIHLDVMDGLFVPNISIGMPVIKSIRDITKLTLDVHLMIDKPERYINEFINAGADIINIHIESTDKHNEIIQTIKKSGKKVGMTIKPQTDYKKLLPFIKELDLILVMGVEPGFGGQKLIKSSLDKISNIRKYITDNNINCELEIDGGIKLDNVEEAIIAGADVIVVGSDIFSNKNKSEIIAKYNAIFTKF